MVKGEMVLMAITKVMSKPVGGNVSVPVTVEKALYCSSREVKKPKILIIKFKKYPEMMVICMKAQSLL